MKKTCDACFSIYRCICFFSVAHHMTLRSSYIPLPKMTDFGGKCKHIHLKIEQQHESENSTILG